jgi:hypothetical protein
MANNRDYWLAGLREGDEVWVTYAHPVKAKFISYEGDTIRVKIPRVKDPGYIADNVTRPYVHPTKEYAISAGRRLYPEQYGEEGPTPTICPM